MAFENKDEEEEVVNSKVMVNVSTFTNAASVARMVGWLII
jgi:hypothetical protein